MQMISGRKSIFSAMTGVIASFCYVAGYRLDTFDTLDFLDKRFYLMWAAATVPLCIVIYLLWQGLDRLAARKEKPVCRPVGDGQNSAEQGLAESSRNSASEAAAKGNRRRRWLMCTALLFLCWLPALLSLFPGAFSYDALDEWKQVQQWTITSHHPVVHVLLLGGLVEGFFRLTGSYNTGIAVYSVLQMLILAGVFASTINFMEELGVSRFWRRASLLFYAFSPVAQLFSICATKDVLFTGAELIFLLYTVRFAMDRELPGNRKKMILFGLSALCTMIFRNNGVYIVLLTLAVMTFASAKTWRQYGKNWILFLMVIFIPYLLYTGPVFQALDVEPGGVEEMLSVPLQQMARVYRYDLDSLEEEERELLYRYVDREALEKYRATVADFVKKGFHREAFEQDKAGFFRLWAKWGISHPLTYLNSFLVNTVDAWYPGAVIDGYRHADGRGSYFDYKVDSPGTETVYLQALHDHYEDLSHDVQAQKKPLVFLILSPGWYFLCTLILFFYTWSRRKYRLLIPFSVFLFHFLTVLLGPMILVRYMLLFFFAFPVVCIVAVSPNT